MKHLKSIVLLSTLLIVLASSCSKDESVATTIIATDYTTSVNENVPVGTSLGSITATSNSGGALSYSITSQQPVNAIAINSTTGQLSVNDAVVFDFESQTKITGVINITTGESSKTINFTVTLVDVVAKKVLVLGAENTVAWLTDVGQKIEDTNFFDVVDTYNSASTLITSTQLMEYDAVLIYTNNSPTNASDLGDNLATYIDNGGAVVEAVFGGNISITGNYSAYKVYEESNTISQNLNTVRTLGTISDTEHPIMDGVSSFNGGTSSYYNTSIVGATGATTLAKYDNGQPLIMVRSQIGQKNVSGAFLNFYPPSSDERNDFWDATTDGGLIIANSLKWVGNK